MQKSTLVIFLFISFVSFSQNTDDKMDELISNKLLYRSFDKFYKDSIRQETTSELGSYYYEIDQINGVHYFDFSNDTKEGALVEFSVRASDGGTFYFLIAVVFKLEDDEYRYFAHLNPNELLFKEYSKSLFVFEGYGDHRFSDGKLKVKKYILKDNRFVDVQN